MDLAKIMKISAAGMQAQTLRLRTIAENIANADALSETPGGNPYRRKLVTFKNVFDKATAQNQLGRDYLAAQYLVMAIEFGGEMQTRGNLSLPGDKNQQVDLVVAPDVSQPGIGFDADTTAVTIVGEFEADDQQVPLQSKQGVATAILDRAARVVEARGVRRRESQ